jgi:peptide/nickel transport system ATP-binding protein
VTDTTVNPVPPATEPLLSVEDLHVSFGRGNTAVQAVAGITFTMRQGETLGLVGESGCGKSTTGRAVVQVEKATSGKILFGDTELTALNRGDLRTLRTQVQMIFQDPISSLNPRRKVLDIVAEPLTIWKIGSKEERVETSRAMLDQVGIDPYVNGSRRPREFSGGQCQRISIARALVLKPKLLVCDEIVSALDVSVQAQILNLLQDLKQEYNLTILFIAHDLAVVKNVSDRVAVMYLGRLCEIAPSDLLYETPAHHYTAALLASAVEPDPEAPRATAALTGEPPSPINPPSGCRFRTRCPRAEARCAEEVPEMRSAPATRWPATSPSALERRRRASGAAAARRGLLCAVSGPVRRLAAAPQRSGRARRGRHDGCLERPRRGMDDVRPRAGQRRLGQHPSRRRVPGLGGRRRRLGRARP